MALENEDCIVTLEFRRTKVLNLLSDHRYHSTAEINSPTVGGSEGTRRLRELRKAGYQIVKRRHEGHDDYEYGLMRI